LRDLHESTRSNRSADIRRRGVVPPDSVWFQSSRLIPTTSRFSPCRQTISETWTRASCTWAEITERSSASRAISLSRAAIDLTSKTLVADALDRSAAGRQLFLQPLEAAVEMIDAVDHGLAFGGKPGDDQRYRGAQIGRHD